MSDSKQCSDAAQTGPGVNTTKLSPRDSTFSGGIGSTGNTKSGSSQGEKRGKQGNG
jgi:hypothetical protein